MQGTEGNDPQVTWPSNPVGVGSRGHKPLPNKRARRSPTPTHSDPSAPAQLPHITQTHPPALQSLHSQPQLNLQIPQLIRSVAQSNPLAPQLHLPAVQSNLQAVQPQLVGDYKPMHLQPSASMALPSQSNVPGQAIGSLPQLDTKPLHDTAYNAQPAVQQAAAAANQSCAPPGNPVSPAATHALMSQPKPQLATAAITSVSHPQPADPPAEQKGITQAQSTSAGGAGNLQIAGESVTTHGPARAAMSLPDHAHPPSTTLHSTAAATHPGAQCAADSAVVMNVQQAAAPLLMQGPAAPLESASAQRIDPHAVPRPGPVATGQPASSAAAQAADTPVKAEAVDKPGDMMGGSADGQTSHPADPSSLTASLHDDHDASSDQVIAGLKRKGHESAVELLPPQQRGLAQQATPSLEQQVTAATDEPLPKRVKLDAHTPAGVLSLQCIQCMSHQTSHKLHHPATCHGESVLIF